MFSRSQIQEGHLRTFTWKYIFLFAGNLLYFSGGVGFPAAEGSLQRIVLICGDHTVHGTFFTGILVRAPGIHTCDSGYLIFFRSLNGILQAGYGHARLRTCIRPGAVRFHIFITNAVVANQRVGHYHCLSCIGRVGQDFQITGHDVKRFNNYLPGSQNNAGSLKTVSSLQNQKCFHMSPVTF